MIIAIYEMPRQEFSLRERVYIHNMYMKSRVLCSETGCVKNRNVNPRRHVLKEETLDDIGERLEHAPQKISKTFIIGNWSSICVVYTKSNKITETEAI